MKGLELINLRDATFNGDEDKGPRNLEYGTYKDSESGHTMGVLVFDMDAEATASNSGKTDVICTAGSSCWLGEIGFKVNVLHTVPTDLRVKRVLAAKINRMKGQLDKLSE